SSAAIVVPDGTLQGCPFNWITMDGNDDSPTGRWVAVDIRSDFSWVKVPRRGDKGDSIANLDSCAKLQPINQNQGSRGLESNVCFWRNRRNGIGCTNARVQFRYIDHRPSHALLGTGRPLQVGNACDHQITRILDFL